MSPSKFAVNNRYGPSSGSLTPAGTGMSGTISSRAKCVRSTRANGLAASDPSPSKTARSSSSRPGRMGVSTISA